MIISCVSKLNDFIINRKYSDNSKEMWDEFANDLERVVSYLNNNLKSLLQEKRLVELEFEIAKKKKMYVYLLL